MARDDEGQQVVAQLGGVHAPSGFGILALEQQIEQIGHSLRPARAPRLDRRIGHALHLGHRTAGHEPSRTRHPVRKPKDIKEGNLARLRDIGVNAAVNRVGIEHAIARECHVGDDIERGAHHVGGHIYRARTSGGNARTGAFGGGGHDRPQVHHVAMREHRRRRAPLPAPMRPFGNEQRVTDRRAQEVLGNNGLRIVVQVFQQHPADRAGVHHHVPAFAGAPRNHRLTGSDCGDDRQHIAPCRTQAGQYAHRFGDKRDMHRNGGPR